MGSTGIPTLAMRCRFRSDRFPELEDHDVFSGISQFLQGLNGAGVGYRAVVEDAPLVEDGNIEGVCRIEKGIHVVRHGAT